MHKMLPRGMGGAGVGGRGAGGKGGGGEAGVGGRGYHTNQLNAKQSNYISMHRPGVLGTHANHILNPLAITDIGLYM